MKLSVAELGLGAWLLVSPWILGFQSLALPKWSSVLVGLFLILASVWRLDVLGKVVPHEQKNHN